MGLPFRGALEVGDADDDVGVLDDGAVDVDEDDNDKDDDNDEDDDAVAADDTVIDGVGADTDIKTIVINSATASSAQTAITSATPTAPSSSTDASQSASW